MSREKHKLQAINCYEKIYKYSKQKDEMNYWKAEL